MSELVGACGLYCGECEIYLAHINRDGEMKRSLAERISRSFGKNVSPESVVCQGCKSELCWDEDCEIRMCAVAKGVDFCFECPDYPCDKLKNFYDNGYQKARVNMEGMRKIGVERWLKEMRQ